MSEPIMNGGPIPPGLVAPSREMAELRVDNNWSAVSVLVCMGSAKFNEACICQTPPIVQLICRTDISQHFSGCPFTRFYGGQLSRKKFDPT